MAKLTGRTPGTFYTLQRMAALSGWQSLALRAGHAGATCVLNPVRMGGHMLARAGSAHRAVEYLADLASPEGDVLLNERAARPEEVGKRSTG